MTVPSIALAIDELEKCGARLTLEQGNIRVVYRTPAAMAPTVSAGEKIGQEAPRERPSLAV